MPNRNPPDVEALIAEAAGLRRLAVRLVGEGDADDVLQDAIAAGIEHAPGEGRALRPWLVRVVRNFAAGRHRGDGRRTAREMDAARRESMPSASDLVERMEVQRAVADEVLRLDEPYRRAVLAVYFEGVGAEEYARGLGVPSATVRSWLKRGLDALRSRLDRRFGGDRAAWSACLAPLARPEATLVPLAVGGVILMKKLVVATAVVLALFLAWFVVARDDQAGLASVEPVAATVAAAAVEVAPAAADPSSTSSERVEAATASETALRPQLRGRVVWLPDRAPAASIGVYAGRPDRPDLGPPTFVASGADGTFRIDTVGEGDFTVGLDRARASQVVRFVAGETREIELELARASTVRGRVFDESGSPVAGAEVYVTTFSERWANRAARSDVDGKFSVAGVAVGPRVFARAAGHSASAAYLLQSFDDPYALDLWLGGIPGSIEGRVVDASGQAVGGIPVVLSDSDESITDPAGVRSTLNALESVRTDALGAFAFQDVRTGRHVLTVHSMQRTVFSRAVEVRAERTTRADFTLPATARLSGRMTDAAGAPCGGAYVDVTRIDGATATSWIIADADGRYDTGFVPAGRVRLAVRHHSGRLQLETELAPGEERGWSPVLGATAMVRGRVVGPDRRPVAGVEITNWIPGMVEDARSSPMKLEATADASGRFELASQVGKTMSLAARRGELVGARFQIHAGAPELEVVFDPPSARIVGRVLDASGAPARDLTLWIGPQQIVHLDADGRFETALLASGTQRMFTTPMRTGAEARHLLTVDLLPGETRSVGDLVLPEEGTLVLALRAAPGVDASRVLAFIRHLGEASGGRTSQGVNLRNDWTAEGLYAGDYRLSISGGGAALIERRFKINAGESTLVEVEAHPGAPVRVDLRGERFARLDIVVRDEAGEIVGRRELYDYSQPESVLRLRQGRYEISATTNDGRSGTTRIEVAPEPDAEQVVRLEVR